jgi:hypothetical protein
MTPPGALGFFERRHIEVELSSPVIGRTELPAMYANPLTP